MTLPLRAFCTSANGLLRELKSEVYISQASDISHKPSNINKKKFVAIWDTGATGSVISEKVVEACNLAPISMKKVNHVGGESMSKVYKIDIICITR